MSLKNLCRLGCNNLMYYTCYLFAGKSTELKNPQFKTCIHAMVIILHAANL